jgi:hypothetical protein
MPGRIVETTGARMFGLDDAEVTGRRRYVGRVRREIQVRLYPCPLTSFAISIIATRTNDIFARVGYES